MTNKEKALCFLELCAQDKYQEAYDKFIAPDFIHHNQYIKGDRESLMNGMMDSGRQSPNASIDVKHIYEDGQTVITHSQVNRKHPDQLPIAVVHIWRFENGKIVELWDLGQMMMKDSPNENGMF